MIEATLAFTAEDHGAAAGAAAANATTVGGLSDREREVLALVARGLSDRQIDDALVLGPHTVHRHVANIRAKLRQPTRAGRGRGCPPRGRVTRRDRAAPA